MARGRRGKRRLSRRDKRSHHNRTRRALSPAVPLAAVPVGLVLAAALIIVTGKGIDPGATEGRIGESITSAVPDAATDEDFFADPTQGPDDSAPSGDNDAQDAQVTASSAPDDENADEEDNGSEDGDGGSGDNEGDVGSQSAGPLADEVVSLVNIERSHHGCDPVDVDERLTAAAQEHSEDMDSRDYMSHHSPEGEGPGERAERHGYHAWGAENVAKGQTSPEQVMDAWMNSDDHRWNILNCDLESIGVGESGHAWTQKFGWE